MEAKTAMNELQAYIRKLKKQTASQQIRKAIERAKALMAYYKGIGIIPTEEERRYKNPVNYIVKKSFQITEPRNFKKKR